MTESDVDVVEFARLWNDTFTDDLADEGELRDNVTGLISMLVNEIVRLREVVATERMIEGQRCSAIVGHYFGSDKWSHVLSEIQRGWGADKAQALPVSVSPTEEQSNG